jgi:hypothetical protein
MVNFSTPTGLEGLFDLDRKGVDIRPTLLRVLTDQYLLSPSHTPEEEQHYTELAMRLIDETDIATRAAVAARLARHASAPRAIMLQLARDMLDIAEPVLRYSPCLTPADCEAIIADRGPLYAAIIAQRGQPAEVNPTPVLPTAARRATPSPAVQAALAELKRARQPDPVEHDNPIEQTEAGMNARELCELFFAAGSSERRLILLSLEFATWEPASPPQPIQRADIWRLESSALKHNTPVVTRELERALGISHQQARRIVDDDQGEAIVAAAKAMNLPADVLQRILLFMNPRIGQSVDRVYELAALYNEIAVEAACRLVCILRAADAASRKRELDPTAGHAAAMHVRRALSEITPTHARRRDAPFGSQAQSKRS